MQMSGMSTHNCQLDMVSTGVGDSDQMNIYIQNLPPPVDDKVLKLIMCAYGEIEHATVIRDHNTNESKCYGFVQFRTAGAAEKAITTLNGNDIAGSPLAVRVAIPLHARQNHVNLYIRNLPRNFDSQHLYKLFSCFGEISSHTILTDDTDGFLGQSRGIGFVRFTSLCAAETAIKHLSGTKPTKDFVQNIHIELADKNDPTIIDKASPEVRPSKRPGVIIPPQNVAQPQPLQPSVATMGTSPCQTPTPLIDDLAPLDTHSLNSIASLESLGPLSPLALQSPISTSPDPILINRVVSPGVEYKARSDYVPGGIQLPTTPNSEMDLSNVYIHGFPKTWDDSDLINKFHLFGKIVSVRVMRTKNGESRGIGFVRFETTEEAQIAISHVHGTDVDGKILTCRIANAKNCMLCFGFPPNGDLQTTLATVQAPGGISGIDPTNVYVHGFPKTWEDNDLIKKFASYGVIVSTRVMRDKTTGESRSIGFVKFTCPEEASRAIKEVHSTMEDGKVLVCRIANAGSIGKSPCKYFKEGRCNKGSNCTFSHDVAVVSSPVEVPASSQTLMRPEQTFVLKESDQLPSYIFASPSVSPNSGGSRRASPTLSRPGSAVTSPTRLTRSNPLSARTSSATTTSLLGPIGVGVGLSSISSGGLSQGRRSSARLASGGLSPGGLGGHPSIGLPSTGLSSTGLSSPGISNARLSSARMSPGGLTSSRGTNSLFGGRSTFGVEPPSRREHRNPSQNQQHNHREFQRLQDLKNMRLRQDYKLSDPFARDRDRDYEKLINDIDHKLSFDMDLRGGKCSPYSYETSLKHPLKVYPISVSDGDKLW